METWEPYFNAESLSSGGKSTSTSSETGSTNSLINNPSRAKTKKSKSQKCSPRKCQHYPKKEANMWQKPKCKATRNEDCKNRFVEKRYSERTPATSMSARSLDLDLLLNPLFYEESKEETEHSITYSRKSATFPWETINSNTLSRTIQRTERYAPTERPPSRQKTIEIDVEPVPEIIHYTDKYTSGAFETFDPVFVKHVR